MKKISFIIVLAAMTGLMTGCSNADDPVVQPEEKDTFPIAIDEKHFPDAAFRAYLKEEHMKWAADGVLTEEEANNVTTLYVTKQDIQGIKSAKGVEWFKNLDMLEVSGQELAEIDVSHNPELLGLILKQNQLTSIDVTKNKQLEYLNLVDNKLTVINLPEHKALEDLWLYKNQLTSLDLSGSPAIIRVQCYSNQIRGKAMDDLIASLPSDHGGLLIGIDTSDPNEGNVITKAQVAAANAKGWFVLDQSNNDYPGSGE